MLFAIYMNTHFSSRDRQGRMCSSEKLTLRKAIVEIFVVVIPFYFYNLPVVVITPEGPYLTKEDRYYLKAQQLEQDQEQDQEQTRSRSRSRSRT